MYAGKYQSQDKRLVLLRYGEEMRKQRAAFHHAMQPRGAMILFQILYSIPSILIIFQP